MILSCPACATRYVVPDSAIGPEGRTVRCAKCKHSWFQDGPELVEPVAASYAQPTAAPPSPTNPRPPQPVAREEAAQTATAEAPPPAPSEQSDTEGREQASSDGPSFRESPPHVERVDEPLPDYEDDAESVSQFDRAPPFRPRRNWLKLLTWGAGGFALLAIAATIALMTLGVPSWLPIEKPLYGADPGLTVEFPPEEQERRTLPNGAEYFGARVIVKNDARETKTVPPLLIVLRDARERVVYSWELVPPQGSLAPGEALTINEAMTDVPRSAVFADIGWAPR